MSTDVIFAREGTTERRMLGTAGAAAHPALANSFAIRDRSDQQSPPKLSRVPRASLPPTPEAITQLSPAPIFDDEVELLEDSGLLTLVAENAEPVEELSARFLIDEEARGVHQLPRQPRPSSDELASMDELDSAHLAFVETKGEIHSRKLATSVPKTRLVSLHEKALADGIAHYSDGVPCHNLESRGQISRTLRVRARPRASRARSWRHVPVLLVFAAGIGAGTFFALKDTGSSASPVASAATSDAPPPSASEPRPAPGAPVTASAAIAEPVHAEPVVVPLGETDEPAVPGVPLGVPLSGVQVLPLPASDETADGTDSASDVVEDAPSPAPARTTPARAHAKGSTPSRPGGRQPVTGTADLGVLMLAAKPPCNIRIDGKDTGLVTPQRVLQLSPGRHKIVLLNEEHGLRDSFVVSIQSGEKTRVIRDNTDKLK